mmetsp:Transcript_38747/g.97603  ORF Transcript_38747/g.97603 Transcript_38747/m.97603 type:complete len:243 (+) Transcript_38747:1352-2080(+)
MRTHLVDVIRSANERSGQILWSELCDQHQIFGILFGDHTQRELTRRNVTSLVIRDSTSRFNHTDQVRVSFALHTQTNHTIVDKDQVTLHQVLDDRRVGDGEALRSADHLLSGHLDGATDGWLERLFHLATANLRTLDIGQDRDLMLMLSTDVTHQVEHLAMAFVRTMRKVQTTHIHTSGDHLGQHLRRTRRRAQSTHDLGTVGHTQDRLLNEWWHLRRETQLGRRRGRHLETLLVAFFLSVD